MLSHSQFAALTTAMDTYCFPLVVFDPSTSRSRCLNNLTELEAIIGSQLRNADPDVVKLGLANVLHWGHATAGYRDHRRNRFSDLVTIAQIRRFQKLVACGSRLGMVELAALGMPEYSGISFLSKIRVFVYPNDSGVLDRRIMRMKYTQAGQDTVLGSISLSKKETRIRPSVPNANAYELWCKRLLEIATRYFGEETRAVDIERGFFQAIKQHGSAYAARILADA